MQIALKFKPRWDCITNSSAAGIATGFAGTITSAPRVFLSTAHDVSELATPPASADDVLKQQRHKMMDLNGQMLYHIKPNTTVYLDNQGGTPSANGITYDKWQNTASVGLPAAQSLYQGLQGWIEWENPPTGSSALEIEIYATYTVSVKKLQE